MIDVAVCVGSSCHLRGAYDVTDAFVRVIERHRCEDKVNLCASFCMGDCLGGCCVTIAKQKLHHVTPEQVPQLFDEMIAPLL